MMAALIPSATVPPMAPTWTVAAPLTTAWTQPPACTSPVPRFVQGYCENNVCTLNTFLDTGLGTGWINQPYATALGSLTETQCQPSGWGDRLIFAYRPATGCPSGYVTGPISTHPDATDLAVVTCCPPNFTFSSSLSTGSDGYTTTYDSCTATWILTSGQPYIGVAVGENTETVRVNSSGTIITTVQSYYTESVIRTGYITLSTTMVEINQPSLAVIVPTQSLPSPLPTGSGGSPSQFSLFRLPFVYSILAAVGIGVGGLALLCITCCCIRGCLDDDSDRLPPPVPSQQTFPVNKPPDVAYPAPVFQYTTIPLGTPVSSAYVASCRHGRSSTCSSRLSYESTCCACKDSRPASPTLTVQARTVTYCYSCQQYWRSCLATQIPPEWRPAANMEDLIDQIIEERKCVHGLVGAACSRCPTGSKTCCACVDRRAGQLLSQEARSASYCETCAEFFRELSQAECPAEWRLAEVQCEHARTKACKQTREYEISCCACKDTRRGTMPRHDRTATYCAPCSSHWNSVVVSLLPKSWGIKCEHADQYTRCSSHVTRGQCCACMDLRRGLQCDKATRITSYCSSCSIHWANTPDPSCPRSWNLKCPHGRANAWEKGLRSTSGPCCCACKDTNTAMLPKATRLRGYCASCRSLWNTTRNEECPPEWQLGCRHNGMATICLNSGSTRSKCCACNDRRTKNLPKASRLRSYCATCETAWNAKPDAQCPPQWRLMEARKDCKHQMALECGNAPDGDPQCCACRDGRKFIALPTRLAGYCSPCRSSWQQATRGSSVAARTKAVPQAWLVNEKDVPIRYTREGCLPRKPKTTYQSERPDTHSRQFDEGPRYGAPRYGRKEEPVVRPLASNNPFRRSQTSKKSPSFVTVQGQVPSEQQPDYRGYEEVGPQRNGPRFTVAPLATENQPAATSTQPPMDEKRRSRFEEPPKRKSTPTSDAEKQRRKDQAGLCVGRKPKFLVPSDS